MLRKFIDGTCWFVTAGLLALVRERTQSSPPKLCVQLCIIKVFSHVTFDSIKLVRTSLGLACMRAHEFLHRRHGLGAPLCLFSFNKPRGFPGRLTSSLFDGFWFGTPTTTMVMMPGLLPLATRLSIVRFGDVINRFLYDTRDAISDDLLLLLVATNDRLAMG